MTISFILTAQALYFTQKSLASKKALSIKLKSDHKYYKVIRFAK